MAFKFNPFTGNLDLVKDTPPAGNDTEIQFNDNGAFGSSANLTYDGTLKVKGQSTSDAVQTLAVTDSSNTGLFVVKDSGNINGKHVGIGDFSAVRIGINAALNATGSNWTAIGTAAGRDNLTGNNWTAIGRSAGPLNTGGNSWTAIGYRAGESNLTGNNWTAIGPSAARSNTSSSWVAIGTEAGLSNTTGDNWAAIGINAAYSNTTGSNWVAIGLDAGRYINGTTTPLQFFQNSTYIGTTTKGTNGTSTALTTNETVIGYQAEGNGSNTVTIGSSAVTGNYFRGSLNAKGQGTTSATNTLALTNSSDDNLLTMKDDGTFSGKNLGLAEYTGTLRIGQDAAYNATGTNWLALGRNAGRVNTSGISWTSIGDASGYSSTTGSAWTAIGNAAGFSNTTGDNWVAIGTDAARNNQTGSFFVAIGNTSGYTNFEGDNWAAIGRNAGRLNTSGSSWVAIGDAAAYSNTTGSGWVAIGNASGFRNLLGNDWVTIGKGAGQFRSGTTSSSLQYFQNSVYIGTLSKGTNGTSSVLTENETVIGSFAEGKGSNTVTIGSNAVTANYFRGSLNSKGQGTTSATTTLALTNSSDANLLTMNDDGTFNGLNIGIGENAGTIRIGPNAAASKTTNLNWVAIGNNAGAASTTGASWLALGVAAGSSNTNGSFWTSIGYTSGLLNTSGSSWTAIGTNAGRNNTTGSSWTSIGRDAGRENLTGSSWVAIGLDAGRYIKGTTTALQYYQNSTYIGTTTKGTNGTSGTPTTNETVIGYAAEGNGSNTVTIGNGSVTDNYFNGDIHAQGSGKGILVTSPDGLTTKRIGIDNSGNLVITNP